MQPYLRYISANSMGVRVDITTEYMRNYIQNESDVYMASSGEVV